MVPVVAPHKDPVIGKFLAFLAHDIDKHPETLKPLSKDFAGRMQALVKGKKIDIEAPIDGDVDR